MTTGQIGIVRDLLSEPDPGAPSPGSIELRKIEARTDLQGKRRRPRFGRAPGLAARTA